MPLGYLTLVLHAHLPYVRHPEHDDFLEEDWLFEAITETYVPLLEIFDSLERDNIKWRLTMSVTPTLAGMLTDPLLQARYVRHLDNMLSLATKELERTRWMPEFHPIAEMYMNRFTRARELFVEQYNYDLIAAFKHYFDAGNLELITCGATHGFLPLLTQNRQAMSVQIELGASEFERHFGRRPKGIWLPECGYIEGVDDLLAESGIEYFFTDTHGVLFAHPRPRYGIYAPIICPSSGVACFGRDTESSKQVWSALEGYPGDPIYRDFYRDIGFDLDYEYLQPHMHDNGIRSHTGMKYFRITGRTQEKQPYQQQAALDRAKEHAANFMFNREKQVEWLSGAMEDRPALIVAPYDAELFGHWWYEGPSWLDFLLRKLDQDSTTIELITIPEYLSRHPRNQQAQPVMSSWGHKGYCEVWLEKSNEWIYPHLHADADRMVEMANAHPTAEPLVRRALNQAARELLLAQASDWAFIMKTGTMVEYAHQRTYSHVTNFNHLYDQIVSGEIDERALTELERRHNIFPFLDYRLYAETSSISDPPHEDTETPPLPVDTLVPESELPPGEELPIDELIEELDDEELDEADEPND